MSFLVYLIAVVIFGCLYFKKAIFVNPLTKLSKIYNVTNQEFSNIFGSNVFTKVIICLSLIIDVASFIIFFVIWLVACLILLYILLIVLLIIIDHLIYNVLYPLPHEDVVIFFYNHSLVRHFIDNFIIIKAPSCIIKYI